MVEFKHRDFSFTGNLLLNNKNVHINLKKVAKDLFVAHFKNQIELKFLETINFKNSDKEIVVLLPLISKYNKRKLTKISKLMGTEERRKKDNILINFLNIEKFLKVNKLLYFLSTTRQEISKALIKMELEKKIKIIDFNNLYVTSYESYLNYLDEMNTILSHCYESRKKNIGLSEIESKLKLPQSSTFFKYLLRIFDSNFSFMVLKDKVVFQKLALSEKERESMEEIERILKKNKLTIFSIENIIKISDLLYKDINDSLWFLVSNGRVIQISEKYFIFKEALEKIINRLKKYKRNQGEIIDIKSLREITSFNRRNLITLFEYFDSQNITKRINSKRKILLVV